MGSNGVTEHTKGLNGHIDTYSIPRETKDLFLNGLLYNPLIAPSLPSDIVECGESPIRGERQPEHSSQLAIWREHFLVEGFGSGYDQRIIAAEV